MIQAEIIVSVIQNLSWVTHLQGANLLPRPELWNSSKD